MKIEVRIAIMSHLSDAIEMGNITASLSSKTDRSNGQKQINDHINFAKLLLIRYGDNIQQEVEDAELTELWRKEILNKK